jgi:phosphoribosylformimino-5-aminoimidazole carboxamide ribotide isomerase
MRILGVIDLMGSQVVRGIAGRRSDYRPIVSTLCPTSTPLSVARALRAHFGIDELYLADLDAIAGQPPDIGTCNLLHVNGFRLWVDAGIRTCLEARILAAHGVGVVVGLETVAGPDALAEILREQGERIVLSLDLRGGKPLGKLEGWKQPTARGIAAEAVALGVRHLLLLDLERVGLGGGTGTEELCASLAASYPGVEILAGGGVRDRSDLLRLKACGVSAVLLASALHDGRLTRSDLEGL